MQPKEEGTLVGLILFFFDCYSWDGQQICFKKGLIFSSVSFCLPFHLHMLATATNYR